MMDNLKIRNQMKRSWNSVVIPFFLSECILIFKVSKWKLTFSFYSHKKLFNQATSMEEDKSISMIKHYLIWLFHSNVKLIILLNSCFGSCMNELVIKSKGKIVFHSFSSLLILILGYMAGLDSTEWMDIIHLARILSKHH